MKKLLLTFLIILFSLTSNVVWSADFQKGVTAYLIGDYATALREWKPLSEQGDADAQYFLGVMYANGYGVLLDYVYAHMWANISASYGDEDAIKLRDLLANEMMTSADISEAQKLARECVANNYKGC